MDTYNVDKVKNVVTALYILDEQCVSKLGQTKQYLDTMLDYYTKRETLGFIQTDTIFEVHLVPKGFSSWL